MDVRTGKVGAQAVVIKGSIIHDVGRSDHFSDSPCFSSSLIHPPISPMLSHTREGRRVGTLQRLESSVA